MVAANRGGQALRGARIWTDWLAAKVLAGTGRIGPANAIGVIAAFKPVVLMGFADRLKLPMANLKSLSGLSLR
jgi:hypothetical protein